MSKRIGYFPGKLPTSSKDLAHKEWESECVQSLEYDPERLQCTVNFWKRGSYTYFDMPPEVFAEFNQAGSRGTYFNLYVRPFYEYERNS